MAANKAATKGKVWGAYLVSLACEVLLAYLITDFAGNYDGSWPRPLVISDWVALIAASLVLAAAAYWFLHVTMRYWSNKLQEQ